MPRNTSVTLGEHLSDFVNSKIEAGRFESASEAVRAGLRLLEEQGQTFAQMQISSLAIKG